MSRPESSYTGAVDLLEVAELEAQWGPQPRRALVLDVGSPFLTGEHQMLVKDGRRAEICYIMHRGGPQSGLLLHIKTVYPAGAYRLPTGGVHTGEAILETLAREIQEETGLQVGAGPEQVQVERMLGIVEYELNHRELAQRFDFATYHFLVRMPADAVLNPQDPAEMIADWQWIAPGQLPAVARTLAEVGGIVPGWGDWGRYRAICHHFVADMLGP